MNSKTNPYLEPKYILKQICHGYASLLSTFGTVKIKKLERKGSSEKRYTPPLEGDFYVDIFSA
jgi:hypothetical protein